MKHEFIPYEEALELKELGYNDYKKLACYCKGVLYQLYPNMHEDIPDNVYREVDTPLYQQAFRWFRENYKLYHAIEFKHSKHYGYIQNSDFTIWCDTYEEAELACLKKLIEIIK